MGNLEKTEIIIGQPVPIQSQEEIELGDYSWSGILGRFIMFLLTWWFFKMMTVHVWVGALLLFVLIVHELGHAFYFWHKNIPIKEIGFNFVFAYVMPSMLTKNLGERAKAYLAGPATGLLFVVTLGIYYALTDVPNIAVHIALYFGVALNLLNLLPLVPLDGGQIAFTLIRSIWKVSHKYANYAAVVVILGYLAYAIFNSIFSAVKHSDTMHWSDYNALFIKSIHLSWLDLAAVAAFFLLILLERTMNKRTVQKLKGMDMVEYLMSDIRSDITSTKKLDVLPLMSKTQTALIAGAYIGLAVVYYLILKALPAIDWASLA